MAAARQPGAFAAWAAAAADRLGDRCRRWITLNEPNGLAVQTYVMGGLPPARRLALGDFVRALDTSSPPTCSPTGRSTGAGPTLPSPPTTQWCPPKTRRRASTSSTASSSTCCSLLATASPEPTWVSAGVRIFPLDPGRQLRMGLYQPRFGLYGVERRSHSVRLRDTDWFGGDAAGAYRRFADGLRAGDVDVLRRP